MDISTRIRLLFILPAIIFDAIVGLLLTLGLYQNFGPHRYKMPLVNLIIRDGILYFAVVFVSNVAWIIIHTLLADKPVSMLTSSGIVKLNPVSVADRAPVYSNGNVGCQNLPFSFRDMLITLVYYTTQQLVSLVRWHSTF